MIFAENLKEFVENNPKLVRRTESKSYPGLFVIKYQKRVFYDNLWDKFLVEARGLVVDEDYEAVIRPFTKIMNRFENNTDIDRDERVVAVGKINGFMAAATHVNGHGWIVSTTGSLDSEYVELAKRHITPDVLRSLGSTIPDKKITWLFEIVDPEDPHIIPEKTGAYLIGARVVTHSADYSTNAIKEEWLDKIAASAGLLRPSWKEARFSDITREVKDCKHEGFVVYGKHTALKIKSPYYLVSKLFARMSVAKLTSSLDNPAILRQRVDEEYYDLIDFLVDHKEEFLSYDEQARLVFIRQYFERVTME